jgi:CheY-like chemotaxis protein
MPTIFLVDDVELFLELERSHLEGRGYLIVTASSGQEALQRLDEVAPDLMLLDLYMPGMDGDEVCRRVRTLPRWHELPIIMVTAAGRPEEVRNCLGAGCDDYITKPVSRRELIEKVQRLLGEVTRRTEERSPVSLDVQISTGERSVTSAVRDLSRNGIYVNSTMPLDVGTPVDMKLRLADGRVLPAMGKVKRVDEGADGGMAVYFIQPDQSGRKALDAVLEKQNMVVSGEDAPESASPEQQVPIPTLLEQEIARLSRRVTELETENREFAQQIVRTEAINSNLSNLYIASTRLHSVLDRRQVLEIIREIVINFVGAEKFAVLTLNSEQQTLGFEMAEGIPAEKCLPQLLDQGRLGEIFAAGEIYVGEESSQDKSVDPEAPLVAIPLNIGDRPFGLLVIYALFIQKNCLEDVDFQLFSMLAEHAATALFSATLHEQTERQRATYKGFMDLLLK